MAEITAALVKDLRDRTQAGMMDCKKALVACDGDSEKAVAYLREKGLAAAAKKAGRVAAEGAVESYIHMGGKIGVLVEVNCETDFVAKSDAFKELCHDVALQIAAANPAYLCKEDVPAEALEKEKEILRQQALNEGKPEKIIERMVEGRIKKFYDENCLLEQAFVKNPDITIATRVQETTLATGEKVTIRRYVRFECGEGIEKKESNLAAEIAEMTGKQA